MGEKRGLKPLPSNSFNCHQAESTRTLLHFYPTMACLPLRKQLPIMSLVPHLPAPHLKIYFMYVVIF